MMQVRCGSLFTGKDATAHPGWTLGYDGAGTIT
jgi:hypothetical protein